MAGLACFHSDSCSKLPAVFLSIIASLGKLVRGAGVHISIVSAPLEDWLFDTNRFMRKPVNDVMAWLCACEQGIIGEGYSAQASGRKMYAQNDFAFHGKRHSRLPFPLLRAVSQSSLCPFRPSLGLRPAVQKSALQEQKTCCSVCVHKSLQALEAVTLGTQHLPRSRQQSASKVFWVAHGQA